ncbi:MAG TPA: hypothetical protein VFC86_05475, partial [Planctomycetota bacterium]|nr:hypothetical protein [Planctomycetota bacterium]
MLRLLYVVVVSAALFAASSGATALQDPPKEPPKKDPKQAPAQKAAPATDEEAEAALATFKKSMTAE